MGITIIGIIFSPLPGIDAVSINIPQIDNDSIRIDIIVKDPAVIIFPDDSTAETIPSGNLIQVTLDGFSQQTILIEGPDDYIKIKESWKILKEYFETYNIDYNEVLPVKGSFLSKLIKLIYNVGLFHNLLCCFNSNGANTNQLNQFYEE